MRFERWYWLIAFCVLSVVVHGLLGYTTKSYGWGSSSLPPQRHEIEITLQSAPEQKPAPPKPLPSPVAQTPKPETAPRPEVVPAKANNKINKEVVREKPAIAKSVAQAPAKFVQIARNTEPQHVRLSAPVQSDSLAPIKAAPGPNPAVQAAEKLANEAPQGVPDAPRALTTPRTITAPTTLALPKDVGGGSLAPDKSLTGKNGAAGPEALPEDTLFTGGGAGGANLPKAPAKIGGGGGNAILSVENPLAKEAIPESKPGIGSGTGGGAGTGQGGGAGFRAGRGIGTRRDGQAALATLNSKPGNGIGAGEGSNIGTKAPGGGKGTGAEMPGTGGEGEGYGRGKGIGVGAGTEPGDQAALSRGIPFGNIAGLLRGRAKGGGGGGPGGTLVQALTTRGGNAPIHIIYVLDTSGSMRDYGKIAKAKDALCRALLELRSTDYFNVINFDDHAHLMSPVMLPATKANVKESFRFVLDLSLHNYTNVSEAMEQALAQEGVTHIFLLSDGEPNKGIQQFSMLRAFIKEHNAKGVQINTLALGVGDRFPGTRLLNGIADDNGGQYGYVDMRSDTNRPGE